MASDCRFLVGEFRVFVSLRELLKEIRDADPMFGVHGGCSIFCLSCHWVFLTSSPGTPRPKTANSKEPDVEVVPREAQISCSKFDLRVAQGR